MQPIAIIFFMVLLVPISPYLIDGREIQSADNKSPSVLTIHPYSIQKKIVDFNPPLHSRLGLAFPGSSVKAYDFLKKAGLGVVRLNASWGKIEPQQDNYNWKTMDQHVLHLQQLGIEPFLTLVADASWGVFKGRGKVKNKIPKNNIQWQNFAAAVAERYDNDGINDAPGLQQSVRYFQFANEWISPKNGSGGWEGTRKQLIEFLNDSYEAVKSSHAKALVVLGGIASDNIDALVVHSKYADYDIKFLSGKKLVSMRPNDIRSPKNRDLIEGIYRVLKEAQYDIADIHLYGPVERDISRIALIRDKIGNLPILSSECGGPSLNYQSKYRPEDHFRAVFERNLTALSQELVVCLWFRLGEGASTFGNSKVALFKEPGKPKPGYHAYRLLALILADMERVIQINPGEFQILNKNGSSFLVAWSKKNKTISLSSLQEDGMHVLRVTDPVNGLCLLEPTPSSESLALSPLPVIVGRLPAALISSLSKVKQLRNEK